MANIGADTDRPWSIENHSMTATAFESLTFPKWARTVGVQNQGAADLYIANHDATGTPAAGNGLAVPAGQIVDVHFTGGQAQAPNANGRTIMIGGGDGSGHKVGFIIEARG